MDAVFRHYVEYVVDEAVPVGDVAASLLANERLLRQAIPALESLFPGIKIETKRVSLPSLSQESPLKELFAFAVVMTFQKDLEKEVPDLISGMLGVEVSDKYDTLLTVLVMILAIWGISKGFEKLFPGKKSTNLDEERARLINVAGDLIQVSPEHVESAIDAATTGRRSRSIASSAGRFFLPSRASGAAEVRSHNPDASIKRAAVEEARSAIGVSLSDDDETDAQPESEFKLDVDIELHASDRDKTRTGWAGHIPGVFEDRVPMRVDKSITPQSLFGRTRLHGDVYIVYDVKDDGELAPREFLLLRLKN
ncbi:hypothetical protein [Afifella pfennigii]|uniref:hypothetical protein n=1 Tax=Afifella pfennigii TaxID=209897 RepID=UPI00047CC63F|nr:hypothetical protein [Afifella pfennigii]